MMQTSLNMPELKTEFVEPLLLLEKRFIEKQDQIKQWFATNWLETLPPIYGSVDLRNAGFKLAPIDMNLFPAGFNNLNPQFLEHYAKTAKKAFEQISPNTHKLLLMPEQHTRNQFYWENIAALLHILETAGFDVRVASLALKVGEEQRFELASGKHVILESIERRGAKLYVDQFCPDAILLNNDLSDGVPAELENLDQPLFPAAKLGWSTRLKSGHFQCFADVVDEFADVLEIDPWLLAPLFRHCGEVNFMQQAGLDCVVHNAEKLFKKIEEKYEQYQIKQKPFLVIKADSGTYGMAVMTVRSIDEIRQMNRKQRTKMATIKGSQPVTRVIIQEGIYSFEVYPEDAVAEPVVYLFGGCVAGGFFRVHQKRGADESLNAPGMRFEQIPFSQACDMAANTMPDNAQKRFYTYGIVAQLSMLAAAREMKEFV